jgi:hypothetical protein
MKLVFISLAFALALLLQPQPATCVGLCPMVGTQCLKSHQCGHGDCACALPPGGGLGVCVATD